MSYAPARASDPIGWCFAISLAFLAICLFNLGIPSQPYFDEVHYLPAARKLLSASEWLNQEHPMLGKEIMAVGIALLGDSPLGWRLPSALAGTLALFTFIRAQWFATRTRFAVIATGILLASGFMLFVHARIAMLDIFMLCFFATALWQLAGAARQPEKGRWRLALAGIALGLSMAAKWNSAPLAVLPGLAFLALRLRSTHWRFAFSRRGAPVPGVTLAEATLWLGVMPLAVYALTYLPAYGIRGSMLGDIGLVAQHHTMLALQESVIQPHPYQSVWYQWLLDLRPIWYLYEEVDGAQRGVLLIGNPLTMLLGLPAMAWCALAAWRDRRWDCAAVVVLFAVSLGFWIAVHKPVQFYYHYFLPSCFLLAALGMALDRLWQQGWRKLSLGTLAASLALFAWFYPILAAMPLSGPQSFTTWMWLDSWR